MAKKSWPSSVALVIQTCPPITTGVDHPLYGISVPHFTLFVSLQRSGSPIGLLPGAETWPSPVGPRNSGQSARAAAWPNPLRTNATATRRQAALPALLNDSWEEEG